jgi:O-antigen chain-terminating methyltransferase
MTKTFDDIDSLIGRLKAVARQHERQNGTQPPPFAYRERLGELLNEHQDPTKVSDPNRPALEELVAASHRDEIFLQRVYRVLMDREADQEGMSHYLSVLPRAGRLYVLAELLCADEARASLAQRGAVIPRRGMLTLPFRILGRLGPLGRALRPLMRLTYRVVGILLRPRFQLLERVFELETNERQRGAMMRDVLLELDGELQRQEHRIQQQAEQTQQHAHTLTQYEQQRNELASRVSEQERQQPALFSALQHHRRAVERLVSAPKSEQAALQGPQGQQLDQQLFDAYYLAFEDACRGSEAQIRQHLDNYQPQWETARQTGTRALDVGCGRGEWLALLSEQGFTPHGVDLNIAMVEHCRERGFDVTHADAVNVMRREPEGSHALVSAFHLIEHLPFDVLYNLVDQANRILAPGGVLILETPNPENVLVGSHTFYHDPTHRNPITPTAISFLLTYLGFSDVEIRRFNPYPEEAKVPGDDPLTARVNGHLCGPQDYAVVGRKAAPQLAALQESDTQQEGDTQQESDAQQADEAPQANTPAAESHQ